MTPRTDRLERFAVWGGWQLGVTLKGEQFEPEPLPGGLPPASLEDLLVIPAGGYHQVVVNVSKWRRMPLDSRRALGEQPGSYDIELDWTGIPWHLKQSSTAPPHRARMTLEVASPDSR